MKSAMPQLNLDQIESFVAETVTMGRGGDVLENILKRVHDRFFPEAQTPGSVMFSIRQVPSLFSLAQRQNRVVTQIISAVATRPVVTLSDLEEEICVSEGVDAYPKLGLGEFMSSLPVVQQFFRCTPKFKPRKISANQFLTFLVFDEEARRLISSGADASGLVHGFAARLGIDSRATGIHIQNLPWLVASIRTETALVSDAQERRLRCSVIRAGECAIVAEKICEALTKMAEVTDEQVPPHLEIFIGEEDVRNLSSFPSKLLRFGERQLRIVIGGENTVVGASGGNNGTPHLAHTSASPRSAAIGASAVKGGSAEKSSAFAVAKPMARSRTVMDSGSILDLSLELDAAATPNSAATHKAPITAAVTVPAQEKERGGNPPRSLSHWQDADLQSRTLHALNEAQRATLHRLFCVTRGEGDVVVSGKEVEESLALLGKADRGIVLRAAEWLYGDAKIAVPPPLPDESPVLRWNQYLVRGKLAEDGGDVLKAALRDADRSRLLLPVIFGSTHLVLALDECLSCEQPQFVLSGSHRSGIHSLSRFARIAPTRLCAIDVEAMMAICPKDRHVPCVDALRESGLRYDVSFPTQDSDLLSRIVEDAVAKDSVVSDVELHQLFRFISFLHASHVRPPRQASPLLRTLAWIPIADPDAATKTRRLSPSELLAPTPALKELFVDLALFHGCGTAPGKEAPTEYLACLGFAVAPNATVALRVLSAIRVGQVVSAAQVAKVYAYLATVPLKEFRAALEQFPRSVILIERTSEDLPEGCGKVVAQLPPSQLCWSRISVCDVEQKMFGRSLCMYYDESLRSFFVDTLGVVDYANVLCWASAMNNLRESFKNKEIRTSELSNVRRITLQCFRLHVQHHSATDTTSVVAVASRRDPVFLTQTGWRSGRDRIIFVGDEIMPADVYQCAAGSKREAIHFFVLGEPLDDRLRKLMTALGMEDFTSAVSAKVTFEWMSLSLSADAHRRINAVVPGMQVLLKGLFPQYYEDVHREVGKMLSRLHVIACHNPFVVLQVASTRDTASYQFRRQIHFHYDAKQATVFTSDVGSSPSVQAESLVDLFCPVKAGSSVRFSMKRCLEALIASDGNFCGELRLLLNPSRVEISAEERWTPSATFSERYREHFPHGTDGLSKPRGGTRGAGGGRDLHHASGNLWKTLDFDDYEAVLWRASNPRRKRQRDDPSSDSDGEGWADPLHEGATGFSRNPRSPLSAAPSAQTHDPRRYALAAEKFVFDLERQHVPPGCRVVWMNERDESGTPYDIAVVRPLPSGADEVVKYIEVKSTVTRDRKDFEMSLRELLFAAKYGHRFTIARVFNASAEPGASGTMKRVDYDNPVQLWQRGRLTMTGEVKVVVI